MIRSFIFICFGCCLYAASLSAETLPEAPKNMLEEVDIENILDQHLPQPPDNSLTKRIMANFKLNNRLVSLWAEKMRSEGNIIVAQGAVRLILGSSELIAQEIRIDADTKTAVAVGRAILKDGTSVVVCDGVTIDLEKKHADTGPLILALYGKDSQAILAQEKAESHKKLPSKGRLLMISGNHLEGDFALEGQAPKMIVENGWASPCACKSKQQPAWAVRVKRLELTQNEDMKLTMPVFEIFGLPMGWLPIAWIPIGTRRSGVLAPIFQLRDGFWAVQPLYLTLGPSWDTTLGPGYVFTRGPRFEGELRWHPRRGQKGQFNLIWQYDAFAAQEHLDQSEPIHRFAGRFEHTGRWKKGTRLHFDLRGMTDKKVPIELGATFGERVLAYTRSGAQLSWAQPTWGGSLSTALFQDLRQKQFSFISGENAIRAQELLRGRLGTLPFQLFGPLWTDLNMGTDLVLPSGDIEDRALTRGIGERLFAQGNMRLQWGNRWGSAFAHGRLRGAQQSDLQSQETGLLAYALLSGGLRTRLVGEGRIAATALKHEILPELTWAQIPWRHSDNYTPFDSDDRMVEGGEVALALKQKLFQKKNTQKYLSLNTALANAVSAEFSPTWYTELRVKNDNWRLDWEGMGRVASDKIDGFRFRFRVPLGHNSYAQTGWWRISENRPRMFYQHLEEPLSGWSITPLGTSEVRDRLDARITIKQFRNFRLSYEAAFSSPTLELNDFDQPFYMLTHGGKVGWTAPCDCMALETSVRFWPNRTAPEIRFSLALSALGETVELF